MAALYRLFPQSDQIHCFQKWGVMNREGEQAREREADAEAEAEAGTREKLAFGTCASIDGKSARGKWVPTGTRLAVGLGPAPTRPQRPQQS